ncbi:hypothetical protein [Lusitaniella coriacea]|uniref:hypothetical protein n=1 Tax=Lusitaniella coriacea TaxID=1983105 RepID=UPI003CF5039C
MSTATLPTTTIPFNQLNQLAPQLRQHGARFRTIASKGEATLVFSTLPPSAIELLPPPLQSIEDNPISDGDESKERARSQAEDPQSLDSGESEATSPSESTASFEQLRELSKSRLKRLAKTHKIEGRSRMDENELASALVGKVALNRLR